MGEARLWQSRLWSKSGIPLGNPIRNPANQRTSFPRIALSFCFTFHLSPFTFPSALFSSVLSTQHAAPALLFLFHPSLLHPSLLHPSLLHSFTLHSFTLHSFTPSLLPPRSRYILWGRTVGRGILVVVLHAFRCRMGRLQKRPNPFKLGGPKFRLFSGPPWPRQTPSICHSDGSSSRCEIRPTEPFTGNGELLPIAGLLRWSQSTDSRLLRIV
jgi:hypothetical protein